MAPSSKRKKLEESSDPLPYTQVDRAVLPIAATLAGAIDVSRQHALGSLIEFWSLNGDPRVLEKLIEQGKFEVLKNGEEIRRVFKLASGKTLEPDAMVDLGLLEKRAENVFRVRGMSRYFEPIKARLEARERARVAGRASAASRADVHGTAQPMPNRGFDGGSTDAEQPPNSRRTPPNQRSAGSGQRVAESSDRADQDLQPNGGKRQRKPAQPDLPEIPPAPPPPPRALSAQQQAHQLYQGHRRAQITGMMGLEFTPDDEASPAFVNVSLTPILAFCESMPAHPEISNFERMISHYFENTWAADCTNEETGKPQPFPFRAFVSKAIQIGDAERPGLQARLKEEILGG